MHLRSTKHDVGKGATVSSTTSAKSPTELEGIMKYEFFCSEHDVFVVRQPMLADHKAVCPVCSKEARRVFIPLTWKWGDSVFRKDGSYREDKDYASLKG